MMEEVDSQEHQDYLQDQISAAQEQLKRLDIQLNQAKVVQGLEEADATYVIYSAKKNHLQHEIHLTENEPVQVIPEIEKLQEDLLIESLESEVGELETVLTMVKSHIHELRDAVAREENKGDVMEAINAKLEKLLRSEAQEENEPQENSVIAKLTARQNALDAYLKEVSGKMVKFIAENYPVPRSDTVDGVEEGHNYLSLKSVIKEIFTKTVDHPNDPYVSLTKRHWEPYVEMLLRCGIALRHPQDINKIKLTPFHL